MQFKYKLKISGELLGYFANLEAVYAYIKFVEGEVDFGTWIEEKADYKIERYGLSLQGGLYEFGYVEGKCLGALPTDGKELVDVGFILAGCNDELDFESTIELVE